MKTFAESNSKFGKYCISFVYWMLFAYSSLVFCLIVHEIFSPKDGYPFGSNIGWNYCSKATYNAVNLDHAYYGGLELITSFLFFRLGIVKRAYGLIAIAILSGRLIWGIMLYDYYPGIWQT